MTTDALLDDLLEAEGGYRAAVKRPNGTWDPDTNFGITAPVLGEWRRLGRRATRAEVKALSKGEARDILRVRYIERPGFSAEAVPLEALRAQLVDFGVNSGQPLAVRWLQRVIQVPVTGVLDRATTEWLHAHRGYLHLVNDALVGVRSGMVDDLTDDGKMRKADEEGVESRALRFLVTRSRPGA